MSDSKEEKSESPLAWIKPETSFFWTATSEDSGIRHGIVFEKHSYPDKPVEYQTGLLLGGRCAFVYDERAAGLPVYQTFVGESLCDADQRWIWFYMENEHKEGIQFVMNYRTEFKSSFQLQNERYSARIVLPCDPQSVVRQSASRVGNLGTMIIPFANDVNDVFYYYPHNACVFKIENEKDDEYLTNQQKVLMADRFIKMFQRFQPIVDAETKAEKLLSLSQQKQPKHLSVRDRLRRKLKEKQTQKDDVVVQVTYNDTTTLSVPASLPPSKKQKRK